MTKKLDLSKFRAFADKLNVIYILLIELVFYKKENIVENGENAGYKHFLLFSQWLLKAFSIGFL